MDSPHCYRSYILFSWIIGPILISSTIELRFKQCLEGVGAYAVLKTILLSYIVSIKLFISYLFTSPSLSTSHPNSPHPLYPADCIILAASKNMTLRANTQTKKPRKKNPFIQENWGSRICLDRRCTCKYCWKAKALIRRNNLCSMTKCASLIPALLASVAALDVCSVYPCDIWKCESSRKHAYIILTPLNPIFI